MIIWEFSLWEERERYLCIVYTPELGERVRVFHHLEAIKVRGQETRKKRVCHDLIPHITARVGGVFQLAVVMILVHVQHRHPSVLSTRIVARRHRKKLPIVGFNVHHVHGSNPTATVPSKPYHHSLKLQLQQAPLSLSQISDNIYNAFIYLLFTYFYIYNSIVPCLASPTSPHFTVFSKRGAAYNCPEYSRKWSSKNLSSFCRKIQRA